MDPRLAAAGFRSKGSSLLRGPQMGPGRKAQMAEKITPEVLDLTDLEPLSKRLPAATEDLNHALATIEEKLNKLALGVEVFLGSDAPALEETDWQQLTDDHTGLLTNERQKRRQELGYGRIGDAWA